MSFFITSLTFLSICSSLPICMSLTFLGYIYNLLHFSVLILFCLSDFLLFIIFYKSVCFFISLSPFNVFSFHFPRSSISVILSLSLSAFLLYHYFPKPSLFVSFSQGCFSSFSYPLLICLRACFPFIFVAHLSLSFSASAFASVCVCQQAQGWTTLVRYWSGLRGNMLCGARCDFCSRALSCRELKAL